MLWTTRRQQAALDALRTGGAVVDAEDVAGLSPLGSEHVGTLGRYPFEPSGAVSRGGLRPLRDPSAPEGGW